MTSISAQLAQYDSTLRQEYGQHLLGTDEAGRGALAGPIAAGAVILPADASIPGLNDSKKMTSEMRAKIEVVIKEVALGWGFALIAPEEIDEMGLTWANGEAMLRAAMTAKEMAKCDVNLYVIDQFNQRHMSPLKELEPFHMSSKMDGKSLSVAAASVIAKAGRDRLMSQELHALYPQYFLDVNKGYIQPDHIEAIKQHGRVKGLHRMSYQVEGVNKPKQISINDLLGENV